MCTPMFIVTLCTTAKSRKQPECSSVGEWIEKLWYIHNGILLGCKTKNLTFCDSMNGPRGYYARWTKPDGERQVPYDFTYGYMWNLKNKINNPPFLGRGWAWSTGFRNVQRQREGASDPSVSYLWCWWFLVHWFHLQVLGQRKKENKINKQNRIQRYREQTDGWQRGGGWGLGEKGEGIKQYKLVVTE